MLLLVLCLCVLLIVASGEGTLANSRVTVLTILLGLTGFVIVASATAEVTVSDRVVYTQQYERLAAAPFPGWNSEDPLFGIMLWALPHVAPATEATLFAAVALACALGHLYALWRLMPPWGALGAWLTTLATGLFFAYVNVAARQGLAVACLMVAVALVAQASPRRLPVLGTLIAAGLLHWSAIPVGVGLLVVWRFQPRVKVLISIWSVLAVAFVFRVPGRLLGGFGDLIPAINDYSSGSAFKNYTSGGDRLDFLGVSTALVLLAVLGLRVLPQDAIYRRLVSAYLIFNCFFLMFGFLAFSDRMASYSWFLGPLLLWFLIVGLQRSRAHRAVPTAAVVAVLGAGLGLGTLLQLAV